jgi:Putative lumazine-binding
MTPTEKIEIAITNFIKGGDKSDVMLLEKVLHPNFQNIQDGFFKEKGVFVFSKEQYINLVKIKKFGGNYRSINFVSAEQMGNMAIAKVILESQYLKFFSTIICVFQNNQWLIINNVPKIEVKQTTNS